MLPMFCIFTPLLDSVVPHHDAVTSAVPAADVSLEGKGGEVEEGGAGKVDAAQNQV